MSRVLYRGLNRYFRVGMVLLLLTLCLYVIIMQRVTINTRLPILNEGTRHKSVFYTNTSVVVVVVVVVAAAAAAAAAAAVS